MSEDFDDPKSGTGTRLPGGFRALVTRELATLGQNIVRWHNDGLDYAVADNKTSYLGLTNLYRRVKTNEPEEAEAIVRHFLQHIVGTGSPETILPDTIEDAAARLLPRIGQAFAKDIATPWSKPLPGTQLHLNLVIDFPHTMAYLTKDKMEKSETPPGDWVDQAIENLRSRTEEGWLDLIREDEGLYCVHTSDSYDASRALILCEMTGNDPAGWLIAIPARDWMFAMKANMQSVPHIHMLKHLASMYHQKQPYPISSEVFWLQPQKPWELFKIEITNEAVQVYPPEAFLEAIGGLESND